jgi:hypothetical protein
MILADVLAVLVALALLGAGFPALLVLLSLLLPEAVERAREQIASRPVRAFGRGLLTLLGLVIVASILKKGVGVGQLLAFATLLVGLTTAMVGGAGLASHLAARYRGQTGSVMPPNEVFAGGLLLELASVVPLVGWFVLLPVSLVTMLGAGAAALLGRARRPEPVAQPVAFSTQA